jgi:hypothetical protein
MDLVAQFTHPFEDVLRLLGACVRFHDNDHCRSSSKDNKKPSSARGEPCLSLYPMNMW